MAELVAVSMTWNQEIAGASENDVRDLVLPYRAIDFYHCAPNLAHFTMSREDADLFISEVHGTERWGVLLEAECWGDFPVGLSPSAADEELGKRMGQDLGSVLCCSTCGNQLTHPIRKHLLADLLPQWWFRTGWFTMFRRDLCDHGEDFLPVGYFASLGGEIYREFINRDHEYSGYTPDSGFWRQFEGAFLVNYWSVLEQNLKPSVTKGRDCRALILDYAYAEAGRCHCGQEVGVFELVSPDIRTEVSGSRALFFRDSVRVNENSSPRRLKLPVEPPPLGERRTLLPKGSTLLMNGALEVLNVQGSLYAIVSECTDCCSSLERGSISTDSITCPSCSTSFALETGQSSRSPASFLPVFKCRVDTEQSRLGRRPYLHVDDPLHLIFDHALKSM